LAKSSYAKIASLATTIQNWQKTWCSSARKKNQKIVVKTLSIMLD
jgi:hypothetical protein